MELISKAVASILRADADIEQEVGGSNIWFGKIPQQRLDGSTEPSAINIRFYTHNVRPNDTKSGRSTVDEHIVRVHVIGEDTEVLSKVAAYVRYALDRITPGRYEGIDIQGSRFINCQFEPDEGWQLEWTEWILDFQFRVINHTIRE